MRSPRAWSRMQHCSDQIYAFGTTSSGGGRAVYCFHATTVTGWAAIAFLTNAIAGAGPHHEGGATATNPSAHAISHPSAGSEPDQLARIVRPRADETKWQQISWFTDLAQAQRVAQQERRPLFVFVSGDNPLEAC